MEKSTKKTSLTKEQFIRECAEGKLRDISNEDLTEIFKQFKKDELDKVDSDLEKTTKKTNDYKKAESYLTTVGIIKKIWVYCYDVEIEDHNVGGSINTVYENQMVFRSKKSEGHIRSKDSSNEGYVTTTTYKLRLVREMTIDEIEERYILFDSKIESILEGEDLILDNWDLSRGIPLDKNDYSETFLDIEELRKQREKDDEPFDAQEIVNKIASENKLTPKKIDALIELLKEIK
jgi:hypothetical protein